MTKEEKVQIAEEVRVYIEEGNGTLTKSEVKALRRKILKHYGKRALWILGISLATYGIGTLVFRALKDDDIEEIDTIEFEEIG